MALTLGLALAALVTLAMEEHANQVFLERVRQVSVQAPDSTPTPGQAAIDTALVLYGIEIPAGSAHPTYEPGMRDRGLTIRGAWSGPSIVLIGPSSFDSWALLGSTLAHELLVHCQQNFFLITVMDLLNLDGTGAAERQAYEFELVHADQFGLSGEDRELIAATVAYYYPSSSPTKGGIHSGNLAALRIQRWLASQILPTE